MSYVTKLRISLCQARGYSLAYKATGNKGYLVGLNKALRYCKFYIRISTEETKEIIYKETA